MHLKLPATFRSLKHSNYRLWFAGGILSHTGNWMHAIAQDWLVLTHLTDHSASAVGVTMACQSLPLIVLFPVTGLVVDRVDRRKLIIINQALFGLLSLFQAYLVISGHVQLWHVYGLAILGGCLTAFNAPASQSFTSEMVPKEDLSNALSLSGIAVNGGRMIGPAIAGLIIAAFGTGLAFLINGLTFGIDIVMVLLMRKSELLPRTKTPAKRNNLTSGLRYVSGRVDLIVMYFMVFLFGTFCMKLALFISIIGVKILQTDAQGFGLLNLCPAMGTLLGGLFAASRSTAKFTTMMIAALFFSISCLAAALSPSDWWFASTLVLCGVAVIVFMNTFDALLLLSTEPEMRGRLSALRFAMTMGSGLIGAPIIGWIADHIGPRWSVGMGGVAALLAATIALLHIFRKSNRPF